jgi:hypothetical protein
MVKPLASGFKLNEENFGVEIWQSCEDTYKEDATRIRQVGFKNCKEDIQPWVMNVFIHRWKLPDITFYTIFEESTG